MDVETLLDSARSSEVFLEETGWMAGVAPEEIERAHSEFSAHFQKWLGTLSEKLGPPLFTRISDQQLAADLYLEATELAAWPHGSGYWVLARGQHDRDTPVFVSFGYREASAV
ncbi:hypothetical protein H8N03_12645 [Ramlibacter sp. USB13]|uniref:Uncharacterized protein n=1 Tax=Ramlibacter cellulosilyticus TaxID=2764187 RepID=A0A923MQ72_9BURK|nr:hypothetical protein [Ramlibacter cellulosilyticus]MBC5783797.1 hypothetical protein [Ramlibacter cellulosilyticus]